MNSAVAMCEALSHANPSTLPVQNPMLPCRRSLVCLQHPTAYRLRYTIRRSGDPQIIPSLPPPPDRTPQPPRRCPIYAPQHCPAAKAFLQAAFLKYWLTMYFLYNKSYKTIKDSFPFHSCHHYKIQVQGTWARERRILDWKRWRICVWEGFAHPPHSWIHPNT